MGWDNDHLYEFSYQKQRLKLSEFITEPLLPFSLNPREPAKPSEDTFLFDWFMRVGKKIEYWYDFGDDWKHELWFEKRLPHDESQILPICLEGEMNCPPEDCGGIWGFYQWIETAKQNPGGDERDYDDAFSYYFQSYDPTYFNLAEINGLLEEEEFDEYSQMEQLVAEMVNMTEPTPVNTLFQYYKIDDNKQNRENFTSLVCDRNSVIWDEEKDKLYPVGYLLKHFKIHIEPTALEIEKGILIQGNRFFPFDNGYLEIDFIKLLYHYKAMEIKTMSFLWKEIEAYYPLSGTNARPWGNQGEEPPLEPDQEVTLEVWDLKEYYQKTHLRPGGSIILKLEDFFPFVFSMKYIPAKKMKKQEATIAALDRELEESLRKILKQEHSFPGVAKQLLFAIYQMGVKPGRVAGSSLDVLIDKSENITCVTLPENGDSVLQLKE